MPVRTVDIPPTLNVRDTVRGAKNPVLVGPTEIWWATRTPDGPGTLYMERIRADAIKAEAWGPGAGWLLDQTPRLLGADDDLSGFRPAGVIGERWRKAPFRLGRTDRPWDALVGAILGQKVQVSNAVSSRRRLARRFGEPAPGPRQGWILPAPAVVASMGYFDFHPLGVERKRAEILIRVAREMPRLESMSLDDPERVRSRLQQIRGIGPWTSAMVSAAALGDPDAVPVGDYHIPNNVSWLLAREPRGTDTRMLELLEPYRGHRWRVIRLAKAGRGAPKYGPRLSLTGDGLHMGR
ncbi:MAG: DNA-3-methyladenine glycosylase 2 family protein [Acidimicrobiia bacterium]|nr:DNA-3-methyladenine glycosylase 2 family protein [Acidimicrobiia bacterium]